MSCSAVSNGVRDRMPPMIASSAPRPKRSSIRPFTISTDSTNSAAASARSVAASAASPARGSSTVLLERPRDALLDGRRAHDGDRYLRSDGVGAISRDRECPHHEAHADHGQQLDDRETLRRCGAVDCAKRKGPSLRVRGLGFPRQATCSSGLPKMNRYGRQAAGRNRRLAAAPSVPSA